MRERDEITTVAEELSRGIDEYRRRQRVATANPLEEAVVIPRSLVGSRTNIPETETDEDAIAALEQEEQRRQSQQDRMEEDRLYEESERIALERRFNAFVAETTPQLRITEAFAESRFTLAHDLALQLHQKTQEATILTQRLSAVEESLRRERERNSSLQGDVDLERTAKDQISLRASELESSLASAQRTIGRQETEIGLLRHQFASIEQALTDSNGHTRVAREQIINLEEKIRTFQLLAAEHEVLKGKLRQLEGELLSQGQQLAANTRVHAELEAVKREVDRKQEETVALSEEVRQLKLELRAQTQGRLNAEAKVSTLERELREVREQAEGQQRELENIRLELATVQRDRQLKGTQIHDLERQLRSYEQLQADHRALTQQLALLEEEMASQRRQSSVTIEEKLKLASQLRQTQLALEDGRREIVALKAETENLSGLLRSTQDTLAHMQQEAQTHARTIRQLEGRIAELTESAPPSPELEGLRRDNERLTRELRILQSRLESTPPPEEQETLRHSLHEKTQEISGLKRRVAQLEENCQELSEAKESADGRAKTAQRTIDAQTRELEQLRSEMGALRLTLSNETGASRTSLAQAESRRSVLEEELRALRRTYAELEQSSSVPLS